MCCFIRYIYTGSLPRSAGRRWLTSGVGHDIYRRSIAFSHRDKNQLPPAEKLWYRRLCSKERQGACVGNTEVHADPISASWGPKESAQMVGEQINSAGGWTITFKWIIASRIVIDVDTVFMVLVFGNSPRSP